MMIAPPDPIGVPLWSDEHGKIRINGTRVLLELLIHAFEQGETAEEIVDSYPTVKLADLYAVVAYYLRNRAEVDAYLREADEAADRIQREVEANYSPETLTLRTRLRVLRAEQHRSGL